MVFDVTQDIKYIGVDDIGLDLFEAQYAVPDGVSYNSYVCVDKKIAVFDTVDDAKTAEWLSNLESVLKGNKPDYLIVSHVEPDHSSSLPAFLGKYPETTVVGNEKTFILLKKFYGDIPNKLTVKDGDVLDLGRHVLSFVFAPMVHWPEVMLSYDKTDKVLFSADAFGTFGALSHGGEWLDEARRYYINIVGKYGNPVQAVLKKVSALDINVICPLHGPTLSESLAYYIDKYNGWSLYNYEEKGVFIAYASVYGHTACVAKLLADALEKRGVKTQVADLNRCDMSWAVATAFKYDKLVIASVTVDAGLMPCTELFINKLKAKNYCNRTVGFIQNGSWAPVSAKLMRSSFESFKNITLCNTDVTVNSALDESASLQLTKLADELSK